MTLLYSILQVLTKITEEIWEFLSLVIYHFFTKPPHGIV